MFGGKWKESSENTVALEIPDPNIDQEGVYLQLYTNNGLEEQVL